MELNEKNGFKMFTDCREDFEEILIDYDFVIQQILRNYRSSSKAVPHIKKFLLDVIYALQNNSKEDAIKNVLESGDYHFVKGVDFDDALITNESFSDTTKSAVFITDALKNAVRCKICNARIHKNSMSIDHIIRKQDGGIGNFENGQLTHPYCNTTYKN